MSSLIVGSSSAEKSSAQSSKGRHHHYHHHQRERSHGQGHTLHTHRKAKHSVHWFRKGLRLSDNPALLRAVKRAETWRCIFILDPWFAGSSSQGVNKWRFLLQCLDDLDQSLRKLNSRLFVVRGQPADVLPQLFREWGTNYFTFEEDPEPYGQVRDKNIVAMCKELNITVVKEASHTLFNLEKIIELNGGKPPLTYRQFIKVVSTMKPPPVPVPSLSSRIVANGITPISDDHEEKYGVPSIVELGFDSGTLRPPVWMGGETEALSRLERHLERKAWVASFGRPKMTPQSLLASQTGLSPYLRFGCLSTRLFYHALGDLYRKIKKEDPPLSLFGQLIWREFFYTAATKNPNFDRMYGNPICVQIPWDKNAEALAKWASGRTGFPWIDAIMTQLREEGWIHHLARHAVACFLTRGDLWISWEEGMKVFDELLLDADWSVNAGTWMWLSCSSFFQQFFHLYCPVKFGRKADPNGDFIRRYLPVLRNFPTRYIHEPWNAPENVQRAAKCVVGKDYPLPMVDHSAVAKINQERMRQVYQQLSTYRNVKTPDLTSMHEDNSSLTKPQLQQQMTPMSDEALQGPSSSQHYQPAPQSQTHDDHLFLAPSANNLQRYHQHQQQQQRLQAQQTRPQEERESQRRKEHSQVVAHKALVEIKAEASPPQEVDFLTPSISDYSSQEVLETLQRDALLQQADEANGQIVQSSPLSVGPSLDNLNLS